MSDTFDHESEAYDEEDRTLFMHELDCIVEESREGADDEKLLEMLNKVASKYKNTVEKLKLKLDLTKFSQIQDGAIFACGEAYDSPEGINMTNSGKILRWVAVKGYAQDWCVYCHWAANQSYPTIAQIGDKVNFDEHIKKLVPCTDEVFARYRY